MNPTILLLGLQKTGNFWNAFTFFNYFNIKNNGATKTLTWEELLKIQKLRTTQGLDCKCEDGFPLIYQSHRSWEGYGIHDFKPEFKELFEQFDIVLYCYRNPFDTIISYYHWTMDRDRPFKDILNPIEVEWLKDIKYFARWFLPKWIWHVKTTRPKATMILDYDLLRKLPDLHLEVIRAIDKEDFNEDIAKKAIEMSSFDNIRNMGIETGRPYGFTPLYKNSFCRDGRTGQYKEIMSEQLIYEIRAECGGWGIDV